MLFCYQPIAALVLVVLLLPRHQAAPSFPQYTSQFNMTQEIWVADLTAASPNVTRHLLWDRTAQRSSFTTITKGNFELQLRRCDTSPQVAYDVHGLVGADPSTFTCSVMTGASIGFCSGGSWLPYWHPPNGTVAWNGTDNINGVQCDRFDFYDNGGTVSFWGTQTAPCRNILQTPSFSDRIDYVNYQAGPPPVAAFEFPYKGLKCKPLPPGPKPTAATVWDRL